MDLTKASTRTGFSAALQSRPVTLNVMRLKDQVEENNQVF